MSRKIKLSQEIKHQARADFQALQIKKKQVDETFEKWFDDKITIKQLNTILIDGQEKDLIL